MSRDDPAVRLRHMLDYAREAVALAHGHTRDDLDTERLLNLALMRLIEMIGEAANRVSVADQARYSDIAWPQIVGMRNRIVHGYDMLDFDILWQTIIEDLPPLIATLESIIPAECI